MTQEVFDRAIKLKERIESFQNANNAIIDAYNKLSRRFESKSLTEKDIVAFVHTLVQETGGELEILTIVKCAVGTINAKCEQLEQEFAEL